MFQIIFLTAQMSFFQRLGKKIVFNFQSSDCPENSDITELHILKINSCVILHTLEMWLNGSQNIIFAVINQIIAYLKTLF